MRKETARADLIVAQIAARQFGVVSVAQLLWAGMSPAGITRRIAAGRLHRLYRGVYAVGHTNLGREGRWLAAVLACGEGAALGFESAGALWGLLTIPADAPAHVVIPSYSGRRKREGIAIHHSATLSSTQTTLRHNIPVTTVARTLRDLGFGAERTRSRLERDFLELVREARLPNPEVNVRVGPYTVDFIWSRERLIVETDGWAYHSNRTAFEADRRRDRELRLRGYVVLRFTFREVTSQPGSVAASLRAHLELGRRAA